MTTKLVPERTETTTPKTRPAKPGTVRCGIVLSQEHHDYLAAEALAADPVYTRPVNEFLSIMLEKHFQAQKEYRAKDAAAQQHALTDMNNVAGMGIVRDPQSGRAADVKSSE